MKEKLILLGGGGHAESVIDTIKTKEEYEIAGILDNQKSPGTFVSGIEVLGCDELLPDIFKSGIGCAVIAVGSVGSPKVRIRLFELCRRIGFRMPTIIDQSAILSKDFISGDGGFIGKGVIIGWGVRIGEGCIINTGVILEHGVKLGNYVHAAPGCILCGNAVTGDCTHIGAGTTVIQNITLGSHSMIGAASLVLSDISSNTLAYGRPAREVHYYE